MGRLSSLYWRSIAGDEPACTMREFEALVQRHPGLFRLRRGGDGRLRLVYLGQPGRC